MRSSTFAFDHGINFIDTAEMYPVPPRAQTYGATETIIGDWPVRQPRECIVLATKVAGPARSMDWIRGGPTTMDRANIRAAIEGQPAPLAFDYTILPPALARAQPAYVRPVRLRPGSGVGRHPTRSRSSKPSPN